MCSNIELSQFQAFEVAHRSIKSSSQKRSGKQCWLNDCKLLESEITLLLNRRKPTVQRGSESGAVSGAARDRIRGSKHPFEVRLNHPNHVTGRHSLGKPTPPRSERRDLHKNIARSKHPTLASNWSAPRGGATN